MIEDAKALFAANPRKSETVELDDGEIKIVELSTTDRLAWGDFSRENEGDLEKSYAFLVVKGCPILRESTVDEIIDSLSPLVLVKIAMAILNMSGALTGEPEKKKRSPRKGALPTA